MNIRVNGEVKTILSGVSVEALLTQMRIVPERAVVEHNGVILLQQKWRSVLLEENDLLEIVSFVGGG